MTMNDYSDIVGQALKWLVSQWRDDETFRKILAIFARELERFEMEIQAVLTERILSNSTGVTLDLWGRIVDQPRFGLPDDAYRVLIRTKVLRNTSEGTPDRLIKILRRLTDAAEIILREYTARAQLTFLSGSPLPEILPRLHDILERSAPAGVKIGGVIQAEPGSFRFDTGPGFDAGKLARLI